MRLVVRRKLRRTGVGKLICVGRKILSKLGVLCNTFGRVLKIELYKTYKPVSWPIDVLHVNPVAINLVKLIEQSAQDVAYGWHEKIIQCLTGLRCIV